MGGGCRKQPQLHIIHISRQHTTPEACPQLYVINIINLPSFLYNSSTILPQFFLFFFLFLLNISLYLFTYLTCI